MSKYSNKIFSSIPNNFRNSSSIISSFKYPASIGQLSIKIALSIFFPFFNNLVAISPSFIKSFLSTASIFRNVTAHNERLYNYSSKRTINIKKSPVLTNNKRQKLFTIYEGLKFFLSRKEYDKLTENLKNIIC